MSGPKIPVAIWADEQKYREPGESYEKKTHRVTQALVDKGLKGEAADKQYEELYDIFYNQRFLLGGRVQTAAGSSREVTAFNCFVMQKVPDSLTGILEVAKEAALTMQLGGGVGYDFSGIRPKGSPVVSIGSTASGPISFMEIFDSICKTIMSAGMRRGAQMGCMRVDHPDVMEFIHAKNNLTQLTQFNLSLLVTDKFMEAVFNDTSFDLVFEGKVYKTVRAMTIWDAMMDATWDWAEPGVIFVDRINKENNLYYCEEISATNPCGEQPLPPYGACLLGSHNLTKYVKLNKENEWVLNDRLLAYDIQRTCRALDNVIDETTYPLPQQEVEAKSKRRMGVGITGLANILGLFGMRYGSKEAMTFTEELMAFITFCYYDASSDLALEKGAFPLFDAEKYCSGNFISRFSDDLIAKIKKQGIRNSHLISIAPTGTISLYANNVSSGIEPVFAAEYDRTIKTKDGEMVTRVRDYALEEWGVHCTPASEVTVEEHVGMLTAAQRWIDSACSKTCNVGDNVSREEFQDVYKTAFLNGAKGCTTFRAAGKRFGILNAVKEEDSIHSDSQPADILDDLSALAKAAEGGACYYDPKTGRKECDSV